MRRARALGSAACAAAFVAAGALLACSNGTTPDCSDAQCGTPTNLDAQVDAPPEGAADDADDAAEGIGDEAGDASGAADGSDADGSDADGDAGDGGRGDAGDGGSAEAARDASDAQAVADGGADSGD